MVASLQGKLRHRQLSYPPDAVRTLGGTPQCPGAWGRHPPGEGARDQRRRRCSRGVQGLKSSPSAAGHPWRAAAPREAGGVRGDEHRLSSLREQRPDGKISSAANQCGAY